LPFRRRRFEKRLCEDQNFAYSPFENNGWRLQEPENRAQPTT